MMAQFACASEGRDAVDGAEGGVGACTEQSVDDVRVSLLDGEKQRGLAFAAGAGVEIGASISQQASNREHACRGCAVEGRLSKLCEGVDICACVDEDAGDSNVTLGSSLDERGPPELVDCVVVGPCIEEELDGVGVPPSCRQEERSPPVLVAEVEAGPLVHLHNESENSSVATPGCVVQWRVSLPVDCRRQRTRLKHSTDHRLVSRLSSYPNQRTSCTCVRSSVFHARALKKTQTNNERNEEGKKNVGVGGRAYLSVLWWLGVSWWP